MIKKVPTLVIVVMSISMNAACSQRAPDASVPSGTPTDKRAIPLYGSANPGKPGDEMRTGSGSDVRNVTYPTLTPVLPKPGTANGAAVIIAPGGGFMFLSMEGEGWQVARKLADQGITAFVLKYRLKPTPHNKVAYTAGVLKMLVGAAQSGVPADFDASDAIEDGTTALKLVRVRAAEWQIDPKRVGMIGFSAGAITALGVTLDADKDNDPATRPPAFLGHIYGPMDAVQVPPDAPPLFAALAMNDGIFGKENFDVVRSWREAKRPVELHVYQGGGHGFGTGKPGTTNALLIPEFIAWLDMQGFTTLKR